MLLLLTLQITHWQNTIVQNRGKNRVNLTQNIRYNTNKKNKTRGEQKNMAEKKNYKIKQTNVYVYGKKGMIGT